MVPIDTEHTGFYNTRMRLQKLDPQGREDFKRDAGTKTAMAKGLNEHEARLKKIEEALKGIPFVPSSTV